ncbi:hypothetical protein [Amycolatopsis sp. NPDC059020]|uniref:hypothetical protein n=2 Tax=Amycolatopsis TaxID=1813 RepID=UPI0036717592
MTVADCRAGGPGRLRWKAVMAAGLLVAGTTVTGCSSNTGATTGQTASASPEAGKQYSASGPLKADTGFRPDKEGFGFQNYGNEEGITNLTSNEMRRLFGDKVCADAAVGKCDLTPEAQMWMEQQNAGMNGGHCYGFSVASLLWWKKTLNPADLGGKPTVELPKDNASAQKEIAYTFVHQFMPTVLQNKVTGTPNDIVDRLLKELRPDNPETWTIGIFKRDGSGGHAVTPYAVEDKGDGTAQILIYDNNFPKTVQRIEVDRKANTWKYTTAAHPNDPAETYDGDANTNTLWMNPSNPGLQQQPFPPVPPSGTGSTGSAGSAPAPGEAVEIFLNGNPRDHGHLVITDDAGRRTGYVNGKLVNEIPGAQAMTRLAATWEENLEPYYILPKGVPFKITLDGSALKAEDTESVAVIGSAFDMAVEGIRLKPGEVDTITPSEKTGDLTYTPGKPQSPTLVLGATYPRSFYSFTLQDVAVGDNGTVKAQLPPEGGPFTVDAARAKAKGSYAVEVQREDDHGVRTFQRHGVALEAGATATFDYQAWDGGGQTIALTRTQQGATRTENLTSE